MTPFRIRIISCLFGFSGAAALIYEVTWSRQLQFLFGSTEKTISTILAGLFVGFSLGSYFFRNLAERTHRPLWHLTLLQLGIGVYGLVMPFLITAGLKLFLLLPDSTWIQLSLCLTLLLIPSTLLGGLWPYLGRCCMSDNNKTGVGASMIYAANSFGSAIGASVAGFILVPGIGLIRSSITAGLINIAVAGVFYYMHKKQNASHGKA